MNTPSPNRRLLHRRWVYRTLREVWLVDGTVVEKHFTHYFGRRDIRPLWRREHQALRRLEGLPVPRSLGWSRERTPNGPRFILRKTYVPGRALTTITVKDAEEIGRLIAGFHARAVVNNDPAPSNFVRTPEGVLFCIDFGRSRTFRWSNPYFFFYVGKELARLHRAGLGGCPILGEAFTKSYRALAAHSWWQYWVVQTSFHYWQWRGQRHHPIACPLEPTC